MTGLTCLCSMATRAFLAEFADDYGGRTGVHVRVAAVGGVDAARRVRAGEGFDVVVLASTALKALAADGFIRDEICTAVARSAMTAAVRVGLPRPPLADEADLVVALSGAGTIAYSTGPSGDHLLRLIDRLGLAADLEGRLLQAPPGVPVAALLAEGRADLGFQQASELIGQPGLVLVGPLPPGCQAMTVFTAGVCASSADAEVARGFIAAMAAPDAAAAKRRHGMEPT